MDLSKDVNLSMSNFQFSLPCPIIGFLQSDLMYLSLNLSLLKSDKKGKTNTSKKVTTNKKQHMIKAKLSSTHSIV